VDILIERAHGARTVRVRDDGVGGANAIRGSGLVGLPDQVEAVGGGTMALDSPPGAGTVLTVRLPVTTEGHLSGRAMVHPRQVSAGGGMRPSPGLRRPPAGIAPLCRYPPGRHSRRRVSRRSRRSCRRAWRRS
jgi:hypothetical protein